MISGIFFSFKKFLQTQEAYNLVNVNPPYYDAALLHFYIQCILYYYENIL